MADAIERQLETIALELHDSGDHESGSFLDQLGAELAALREERDEFQGLLAEWQDVGKGWYEARLMDSDVTDLYDRTIAALGLEDAGA